MSGWVRFLAVALAVIAVWLVIRQVGIFGFRPFGTPRERPPGPPVVGARGRLAYVRAGDLYTYDLRDGSERRLTRSGGVSHPRWSGGGTWLAFERSGRLVAIRHDGSAVVDVPGGDMPASGAWSPVGARLGYASSDGSLNTFEPGARANQRKVLVPAGSSVGEAIVWTTDGIRLAYERHERVGQGVSGATIRNEGIWNITETGRNPIPVFLASGDVRLGLCCWTSTAAYILFWQSIAGVPFEAGAQLLVSRTTSSQPAQVVESMLPIRTWASGAPRVDGVALVAGGGRPATESKRLLVALPRTLQDARIGVDTSLVETSLAPASPAFAPLQGESAMIAYSAGPPLAPGRDLATSLAGRRIWLARPDGSQKRALLAEATVPEAVSDERPLWPRDARTLVFARRLNPAAAVRQGGAPDSLELWVATADGTQSRRVAGGLADPGGADGLIDWAAVFDYYRG
ncbi:MAG TPA: hypothetical protein VFN74_08285 [Chloroflexota bacterium]|nr:hypothetical protein [Chloroflexota bacterium]